MMKKHVFIVLITLFYLPGFAQVERVKAPVSQDEFETMLERIQVVKSPAGKLEIAMTIAYSKHFTCRQIQEVAFILPDDNLRLQFALKAYERAVNPSDYYSIMDAFERQSTAFRFYDAKEHKIRPRPQVVEAGIIPDKGPVNVETLVKYPDVSGYTGKTNSNCKSPVSMPEFKLIADQVRNVKSPQGKLNNALQLSEKFCLSVAQMMKLSLLMDDENIRYKFFAGAYDFVFDVENFLAVKQMLETDYYKNKIMQLHEPPLNEKPKPLDYQVIKEEKPVVSDKPSGGCQVGERELNEMVAFLKEQSFESDRIEQTQTLIKLKRCFRTEQIMRILAVFDYESSKLDMAKFAFPYVTDKANYYKVSNVFEFSSSKEDFNEFIDQQ